MIASPWDPLSSLDDAQREQLRTFEALLREMNRRINLISRADEDRLFERHIQHCLSLTCHAFPAGAQVVDWGSGGGFPAIPLAIAFPDVRFTAVDAVGKKMHAVRTMSRRLGLRNLDAWHGRAEAFPGKADYSVSRATAPLETLWTWHLRAAHPAEKISGGSSRAVPDPNAAPVKAARRTTSWEPGLIALKGGELDDEINRLTTSDPRVEVSVLSLRELLPSPFFAEKVIVSVRRV